jgi:hypothetical protein
MALRSSQPGIGRRLYLKTIQFGGGRSAAIVILAWRYAEPIMRKHQAYLAQDGTFIIPLPDMKIVSVSRPKGSGAQEK